MKDCYDRNNARNRDSFSVTQSNGMLKGEKSILPMQGKSTNLNETENSIIDALDQWKKDLKKVQKA